MTTTITPKVFTPSEELAANGIASMEHFSQLVDIPVAILNTWRDTRRKTYNALLFSASVFNVS